MCGGVLNKASEAWTCNRTGCWQGLLNLDTPIFKSTTGTITACFNISLVDLLPYHKDCLTRVFLYVKFVGLQIWNIVFLKIGIIFERKIMILPDHPTRDGDGSSFNKSKQDCKSQTGFWVERLFRWKRDRLKVYV